VYFGQDAGALGALEAQGRFATLPDDVLELVDPRYRSRDGRWTGITGRSRNLVVNTDRIDPADSRPRSSTSSTRAGRGSSAGRPPTDRSSRS
jgi:iron(III) transport system substrate-binding protein